MQQRTIFIYHQLEDKWAKRFLYTLDFLNQHPLNPKGFYYQATSNLSHAHLTYGKKENKIPFIPIETKIFTNSTLSTHSFIYKNRVLNSVSSKVPSTSIFYEKLTFGFDLFATIFYHISRYEEVFCDNKLKGPAGWLKERYHFLLQQELLTLPVVDHIALAFFEIMSQQKIESRTSYSMSHDVDILTRFSPSFKFIKSLAASIYYRRGWQSLQKSLTHYRDMRLKNAKDPYDYFEVLLRTENFWTRKSIYFMTGGNTSYDNKYKLEETMPILQMAKDRGYQIGLHPSFNAGFNAIRYQNELERLEQFANQKIVYNRQHWLRWDWDITPYLFSKNKIKMDSTLGYNQHLGFRAGTGFAYHLYDFKNEKAFEWKEQPMALMESAAIHLSLRTGNNIKELMRDFILKNEFNTHIDMNFHNSNFDPLLATGRALRAFYEEELLDLCHV